MARTLADLIPLSQAAGLADVHQDTLRVQIHNGRLKGQKLGRDWFVTRKDLDAYLAQRWTRSKRKGK